MRLLFSRVAVRLVAFARLGSVMVAVAATPAAASVDLNAAKTIRCRMTANTTVAWKDKIPTTSTSAESLDFTFDQINLQGGSAHLVGNASAGGGIIVFKSKQALHFIEPAGGGIDITTVFNSDRAGESGQLVAVESRHFQTSLTPFPMAEELRGTCTVLEY